MIKKYAFVIGIDTGVNTGVATWNVTARKFELIKTTAIHKAMMYVIEMYKTYGGSMLVRVEDARLRTWYQSVIRQEKKKGKCCRGLDQLNVMLRYGRTF